jgi:hypothetical protein
MRHARVEGLMADGEIVRLRYLDNGEVANLDTLTLVFTPDVNWRLVSDAR